MYRAQLFGPRRMAVHWHMHHDGARHYRMWQRRGEKMPLAIALGGESVLPYAATAPLPPGVDETLFAGFLNGSCIELVKCRTIDLEVPANAEIVIEGYVDSTEKLYEGPFGDHTGFYSLADWYPAFHVTAITHRKDPIYPTTIVGKPPMEDYFLGKATERIFLPLLKMIVPDILDYSLPISGAFHNCAYIKIRKEYPMQARRVMHAIWGAGQMSFTKFIVVVDEDVDVHDEQKVLFHLFANCDPQRDSEIVHGPVDILDHASPEHGAGSKIGFDATRKWPGEGRVRHWPTELEMDAATKELVSRKWKEYGLG
jgi:4-hydroxy-3-polyprenylbenzoate decarboxylase